MTDVKPDERAQMLQDFMEYHHGRCLRASEWDAIVAFLDKHPRHQPQEREAVQSCDTAWLWSLHTKAQSEGREGDRRKLSRIIAALTTPAPAVSTDELRPFLDHKPGCRMRVAMRQSCVCGFRDILPRLRGEK